MTSTDQNTPEPWTRPMSEELARIFGPFEKVCIDLGAKLQNPPTPDLFGCRVTPQELLELKDLWTRLQESEAPATWKANLPEYGLRKTGLPKVWWNHLTELCELDLRISELPRTRKNPIYAEYTLESRTLARVQAVLDRIHDDPWLARPHENLLTRLFEAACLETGTWYLSPWMGPAHPIYRFFETEEESAIPVCEYGRRDLPKTPHEDESTTREVFSQTYNTQVGIYPIPSQTNINPHLGVVLRHYPSVEMKPQHDLNNYPEYCPGWDIARDGYAIPTVSIHHDAAQMLGYYAELCDTAYAYLMHPDVLSTEYVDRMEAYIRERNRAAALGERGLSQDT